MARSKEQSGELLREQLGRQTKCAEVTSWAVGRIEGSQVVAIQLNDGTPFLLKAAEAKKIAAALRSEADIVSKLEANPKKR
jgi:hypothetical protein